MPRHDVVEVIQGNFPNEISIYRQILACFSVATNGSTQFLLIGQDLRRLAKKSFNFNRRNEDDLSKLAQLMPYKMYCYNSRSPMICFNVEDVSRPSCFVSVKHGQNNIKRARGTGSTVPIAHETVPQFWGFPLTFCDRSLYAEVSIGKSENDEAVLNGLQPYIVSDSSTLATVSLNTVGGEDSGDEDAESDSDIEHLPVADI